MSDRSLIFSRLRGRIMDGLHGGEYERRSATAEYIARTIMEAPELVVTLGEWPHTDDDAAPATETER